VIEVLREAHQATAEARAGGKPEADAELLATLRQRYGEAVAFGITHNRLRDWNDGNHPGYAPGCWLRDYADQVWLFTREPAAGWANNTCERGAKAAKPHQAVCGYWHTHTTLAPPVPDPQLPRLGRVPRPHRTRRRRHCPQRQTMAATAGRRHRSLKSQAGC
jgi:hypothetical protein